MKTITIIVFGETAKAIEKSQGLEMVGDETDVYTKVYFRKMRAEGRCKIEVEFDV